MKLGFVKKRNRPCLWVEVLTNPPIPDFPGESWCCCQGTSLVWNCLNEVRTGEKTRQQPQKCASIFQMWNFCQKCISRNEIGLNNGRTNTYQHITVPCRSKYLHSPEKIKNQTICVSASNGCILHDIGKLWILPRKLRNWENDEIQGGIFSSYIFITHLKHQFLENLIKPTLSIKKYLLQ